MHTTSTDPDIRQEQQPNRALLVFALSGALLGLLDSERLSGYLERLELPGAPGAAEMVREIAHYSGAALISRAETRFLAALTPEIRLGSVPDAASAGQPAASRLDPTATEPAVPEIPEISHAESPTLSEPPTTQDVGEKPWPATLEPATEAVPVAPAQQPPVACDPLVKPRVLIVGDSLIMEGLGPSLLRTLRKNEDITVVREGRYSTGLTRTDTFDWPGHLTRLVPAQRPDLIVVCLGANDGQDILVDGKRHITGTPSWQTLYRQRADSFLQEATAGGAQVLWLGLPIMGSPQYDARIRLISSLQQAACEAIEPLCRFTDNVNVLADSQGNYLSHTTDAQGKHIRLRYKDKIHVTEQGGQLIVNANLSEINALLAPKIEAREKALENLSIEHKE